MRWALALLVALVPVTAHAGDAEQCARAYEHGQELRVAKKLSEAREQFLVCARPTCPKVTQNDCTRWLGEVEAVLPGIVVHAKSGGAAFEDARVLVDGKMVAEHAEGRPIVLDPGKHVVRVEPRGCAPHEKEVTLGASGVPAEVDFDVCTEPKPIVVEAPAKRTSLWPPPLASLVLGGVTVAALVSFAAFGAVGVSDANHLRDTCYPNCEPGPVAAANAELAAADVSLGIAIACAAAAAIVWLVAPRTITTRAELPPLTWTF